MLALRWGLLGAAFCLLSPAVALAQTPSFPCNRAQSPLEIAVCADGGLATLDRALDQTYRRARDAVGSKAPVLADQQRQWLRSVGERCGLAAGRPTAAPGIACIAGMYRERIAALGGAAPGTPPAPVVAAAPSPPSAAAAPVAPAAAAPAEPARPVGVAALSITRVPAKGRSEAILTVTEAGRFAIQARSAQGTSIELVDRVLGPIASASERLDATLEVGRYKLILRGDERAEGDAELSVEPFSDLTATPPLLAEGQAAAASLADRQQRSYWFQVTRAGPVFVQAVGRDVADLGIRRDGTQAVEVGVARSVVEPTPAQPLRVVSAWVTLEPGNYLLTAFGGVGGAWARESPEHPIEIQVGLRSLAEAGRIRGTLGRTGLLSVRVPPATDFVRLTLPDNAPVRLAVADLDAAGVHDIDSDEIEKARPLPVAELSLAAAPKGSQGRLITVSGAAGQPYTLSFVRQGDRDVDGSQDGLWVSEFYLGEPTAVAAATAVLADSDNAILNAQAVRLGTGAAWSTRINLLEPAQVWLEIANPGRYTLGVGNDAALKLCPAGDTENCQDGTGALTADLDKGIFGLTVTPAPKAKGAVDLSIRASGVATARPAPTLPWNRVFEIGEHQSAKLQFGSVPGVAAGAVVRALPLDLAEDVPGVGWLQVKVAIPGPGTLTALAEDGRALPIAVGPAPAALRPTVAKGTQTLTVDAGADTWFSIHFEPPGRAVPAPPATMPTVGAPAGSLLALDQPAFVDLGGATVGRFRIGIGEAGLYRLTSLGRLDVQGELRRGPSLVGRAHGNGVGHNFLIQRYLRDGDYAASVQATGRTAGRAGVALTRVAIVDRGAVGIGTPFRAAMGSGEAPLFHIDIGQAADYRVELYGHGTNPDLRIEDDDGWPLGKPDDQGRLHLDPGRYRLMLIPDGGVGRAIGRITRRVTPLELVGHGPHPLPLNGRQAFRWLEPANPGDARTPDQWDFALAAPTDLTFEVSEGMAGEIQRLGADAAPGEVVGRPVFRRPVKPFDIKLAAGRYQLTLRSIGPNNRLDYSIQTSSKQLLAGQSRTVTLPTAVPFALGADGVAVIDTWGPIGVSARISGYAADAGRADDWNARIARPLAVGSYTLSLERSAQNLEDAVPPKGDDEASTDDSSPPAPQTTVRLRLPIDHAEPALAADADLTVADGDLHTYPLTQRPDHNLQVYAARSTSSLAMTLERAGGDGRWTLLDQTTGIAPALAMITDPAPDARYRLRVWTLDGEPIGFSLAARSAAPAEQAPGTITLAPLDGPEPQLGVAVIRLAAPALVDLGGDSDVHAASRPGAPLITVPRGVLAAGSDRVALLRPLGPGTAAGLTVRPIQPEPGRPVELELPAGERAQVAGAAAAGGRFDLWLAEAHGGVPGIAAGGAPMAAGDRQAVAVGAGPVALWNADSEAAALTVTVSRETVPMAAPVSLPPGTATTQLQGRTAGTWSMAAGSKRLQLDLPPATAAVLEGGSAPTTIWSGVKATSRTLDSDATRLVLVHAADGTASATLAWTPVAAAQGLGAVRADAVFRRFMGTAGSLELPVEAGAPALHVRGDGATATFIDAAGRLQTGRDLAVDKPGRLILSYGPGFVAAWLDGGSRSLWPTTEPEVAAAPSVRPLAGQAQALRLHLDKPAMVHVRSSAPVLAALRTGLGVSPIELFPGGADFNRYAPAGDADLLLESAADGPLTGSVELATTDVMPIGEGLGPHLTLGPGASRLFSFAVDSPTTIGIGVRANVDIADCRLFDAAGRELGRGVIQMPKLEPGTYVLAVVVPPDAPTVDLQPALVGLVKPDDGPPPDVRGKYLEMVGLTDAHRPATP